MMRNVRPRLERPAPVPEIDIHEVPRPRQPAADPAVPPVVHPGDEGLHPFLQFTDPTDRTDRDILLTRARSHGYAPLRYLSWSVLQTLEVRGRVEELCGPHWRALFDISEAVSEVLTIEFLSTIRMLTPTTDLDTDAAITFRLGGVERRLSLRQFGVAMGIYRMEDLDTPAFTEGWADFPEGVTVQTAWSELGLGPYKLPNPKSTGFREHAFRIIHRAIAHGIAARGGSAVGNVMHFDLFYLYCMIHHQPCQIAERLARYLFLARRQKGAQQIFGGGYVTRLAQYFGVEAPARPVGPRFMASAQPIDLTALKNMGMIVSSEGGYMFRPIVDPSIRIAPRAHDREAGPSGTVGGDESAGGSDQAHASTQVPIISETPAPPPVQTAPVRSAPEVVHERGYTTRTRRIEREVEDVRRMVRLECAEAAAHRHFVTRALQLLAASASPAITLPEPPVPSQELADFVSQAGPSQPPPQQPPTDPSSSTPQQPPADPSSPQDPPADP